MNIKTAGSLSLTFRHIVRRDPGFVSIKKHEECPQDVRIDTLWFWPYANLLFLKVYDMLLTVAQDDIERFMELPGPGSIPKQFIYIGEL